MHRRLAWDDLLYVLAVGRAGSLSGAARALQVNHSTVFRRIAQVEDRLNVRLFERRRDGYSPTTAGEAMIAFAETMDEGVVSLERRLAGEDLRPQGTVRLATTDTLMPTLLGLLPKFSELNPDIRLEILTGLEMVNLTKRDADLALRATIAPEQHLFGRRLARIGFAVYGARDYIARAGGAQLHQEHVWVGLDDTLAHTEAYKWLKANAPAHRTKLVVSSLSAALAAAQRGMGLALLPCYMAAELHDLERCSPVLGDVASELWLLVHEDLRKVTRVRSLMDFLIVELVALRSAFEGKH